MEVGVARSTTLDKVVSLWEENGSIPDLRVELLEEVLDGLPATAPAGLTSDLRNEIRRRRIDPT